MERLNICGCLLNASEQELLQYFKHPGVDLLEWRLDSFIHQRGHRQTVQLLSLLSSSDRHPVVVTNRPEREGGLFAGSDEDRMRLLWKAADHGADWIDLEDDVPHDHLAYFQKSNAGLLISHHDFGGTPDQATLGRLAENMAAQGARAIKLVTLAQVPQDNIRVLDMIGFGKKHLSIDVIAFCMGPLGRWSRLACLLLGSPWTYARLPGQISAAPGQPTIEELRRALELLA
ncbi:type I 3-dehydroquinate dehydratase [Desulfoferrobacter suflitae]|uniref:type I 3-dehydroquinate dehydratase n=1 Tax=Desulfoferrobacter suflitae TaxID=2865782 RepID=UPI002164AB6F|nr:type I 3-dehydroquinate dehydratase [Desulfoferrobacter suflitae]MCK8600956.1 type I 3-dehydroquinate dehydratase [Desulfoferrobacter suflitae]